MVVPFAAGSGADVTARIFAKSLSGSLGAQVVVDNIGGAGGMTAASRVAKAAPDGYQFIFGTSSTHAIYQALHKTPPYNAATDFAPVALFADQQIVLIARKDLPVGNLQEFIAYTKANQSKMQFGSTAVGSITHLACALLNSGMGVDVTHIPYRTGILALPDMIGGRIDYMCLLASSVTSQIQSGQVKGIAMLSRNRSSALPNLASTHEQGVPNLESDNWNAFFLPRGTPQPIVQKLNAATVAAMDDADVRSRLNDIGVTVVDQKRRSSEYLAGFVSSEIVKWAAAVKAAGLVAD